MKKLISFFSALFILIAMHTTANAEFTGGVSLHVGEASTDGTETEKTVTGVTSEKSTKSVDEIFVGASIFGEYQFANGFAIGVDYVPLDIELGSGKRTDATTDHGGADVDAATDTGDRSASADLEDLITIYAHVPMGPVYGIVGYHNVTVSTKETLPTSSYGNADIDGYQIGLGVKRDRARFEVSYSDFDDISLTGTGNTTNNSITADADAIKATLSFSF